MKRPITAKPKSRTGFGSQVKPINPSTRNQNVKQNFQFYSCNDRREVREMGESRGWGGGVEILSSSMVQKQEVKWGGPNGTQSMPGHMLFAPTLS